MFQQTYDNYEFRAMIYKNIAFRGINNDFLATYKLTPRIIVSECIYAWYIYEDITIL